MTLCDKCRQPIEVHSGFALFNPTLGRYHIRDDCGLVLDKFIDTVDNANERRATRVIR